MSLETLMMLPLGFGLGLVHALDADHVMAVSALAARKPGGRGAWMVSLWWSLGHSGSLLVVACIVLPLGWVIPPELAAGAEGLVGLVLIGLGFWVAWGLVRRRGHIHFHRHEGLPEHAHWHAHDRAAAPAPHHERSEHGHVHAPLMMGALHGLAGSAPLLALIPVMGEGSLLVALGYLVCFGSGVMIAMLLFGGVLGRLASQLSARADRFGGDLLRSATAVGSIAVGLVLLARAA